MNFPTSQPVSTFLQQRPPPALFTDCFFTYTRINGLCKPIDRIADSVDPFELANNPNQIPSTNIAQDVHQSVAVLHEIQKSIYSSLTPTQTTLFTIYHNLLLSIARYLSQTDSIPQPMPAPRLSYSQSPPQRAYQLLKILLAFCFFFNTALRLHQCFCCLLDN